MRNLGRRFADARLRDVPVLRAAELDGRADPSGATRVWLALEVLQVTGSFKVRGALVAADAHRASGHLVSASAGNHGAAVAYAARVLGLSATVCVPRTTARVTRAKIRQYGAELVVSPSDDEEDVSALATALAARHGAAYVPASGSLEVTMGNGTSLGFEIVRALGGLPERMIAPIGRGGLATGIAWALDAEADGRLERGVWGAQSEACCAMALSLECGRAVLHTRPRTDATPTLADSLTGGVAASAFARARGALAGVIVVSEDQIAATMAHAYREMGLVLEGSAAVALAPVLIGLPEPVRGGDLVVVLTGRNVDPERLDAVLARAD
ncbi:MAG: pyridoxal-phosphate dependent enzyme [Myxococcota bacterium]|nr:pyridoxal-phosphate dependent enzyme [Myxococcota bacterium]